MGASLAARTWLTMPRDHRPAAGPRPGSTDRAAADRHPAQAQARAATGAATRTGADTRVRQWERSHDAPWLIRGVFVSACYTSRVPFNVRTQHEPSQLP